MASYLENLSERDVATLAGITGREPAELKADLRRRPWSIHDLLSEEAVFQAVMDRQAHPSQVVSPFLLFAVIVHRAAGELREVSFVNDWSGPRSRLPVFDVEPLREFVGDPGRTSFLARLLSSFAVPELPPVPADPFDLEGMASWLGHVLPGDRVTLLRRLGDLALFLTGVFPDRTGAKPFRPVDAERLGRTVDMTSEEILALCDPLTLSPGLDALESLGARWYGAAVSEGGVPPVVGDVAARFRSARRVLNHLADRYLYELEPTWNFAA
jgi:hypothetical protein